MLNSSLDFIGYCANRDANADKQGPANVAQNGPPHAKTQVKTKTKTPATPPLFVDVTRAAGIDFHLTCGSQEKLYIVETHVRRRRRVRLRQRWMDGHSADRWFDRSPTIAPANAIRRASTTTITMARLPMCRRNRA